MLGIITIALIYAVIGAVVGVVACAVLKNEYRGAELLVLFVAFVAFWPAIIAGKS